MARSWRHASTWKRSFRIEIGEGPCRQCRNTRSGPENKNKEAGGEKKKVRPGRSPSAGGTAVFRICFFGGVPFADTLRSSRRRRKGSKIQHGKNSGEGFRGAGMLSADALPKLSQVVQHVSWTVQWTIENMIDVNGNLCEMPPTHERCCWKFEWRVKQANRKYEPPCRKHTCEHGETKRDRVALTRASLFP